MKMLAIETSCDETSIALLNSKGSRSIEVLSHVTHSQAEMHAQYGGVFPAMAKREHTKNIMPILFAVLQESQLLKIRKKPITIDPTIKKKILNILDREPELADKIILLTEQYQHPKINAVAVTYGPGLEIALWTGFNIARALSVAWDATLVPTNHMEGHIYAALLEKKNKKNVFDITKLQYPSLGLLISGGHTELVMMKDEHQYNIIGQTLDDAVGECYDKSARLLGLPYPGGKLISDLAESSKKPSPITLPRPVLHTNGFNFSFSGLKTAVLQQVQKKKRLSTKFRTDLSVELENAVSEVLVTKTKKAILKYDVKNLVIGGGVSANTRLRRDFNTLCKDMKINLYLPDRSLSGDNALMIGLAGYRRLLNNKHPKRVSRVTGNLKIDK